MKKGMKINAAVIMEWVGPLCIDLMKSMSMSGMTESTKISGILSFVLSINAEGLPSR